MGTPIGNLEDVTQRALRVLTEVSVIAAEDTRVTSRLLARYAIRKPFISYRAPVERRALPAVLEALSRGDVALVSDAGTPTLSDPGQRLVEAAVAEGHRVVPIPGPSAITAALSIAGFAGGGFIFLGYLPRKPGERRRLFASLAEERRPAVAFESPHRILKSLAVLEEVLPDRRHRRRDLRSAGSGTGRVHSRGGGLPFVDTHLHLEELEHPGAAVTEAVEAGVGRLITMGTDLATSTGALALAEQRREVYAAVGHQPMNREAPDLDALRSLAAHEKAVAIGEVGVDGGHTELAALPLQVEWFASLCDLALELGLPVCVHTRDSA
ncbi:MAG: 16S rRNA (cytidine(1402)-2'-O)-methyltransferase, partial [Chloroflexi bacterium]